MMMTMIKDIVIITRLLNSAARETASVCVIRSWILGHLLYLSSRCIYQQLVTSLQLVIRNLAKFCHVNRNHHKDRDFRLKVDKFADLKWVQAGLGQG